MAVRSAENKATSTFYIYTQEVRIVMDIERIRCKVYVAFFYSEAIYK